MSGPFDALSDDERDVLESRCHPDWLDPMLATLSHDRFSDPDWIYERKLDGERCLAFRDRDRVRLLSRNRTRLNDSYPELEAAIARQPARDFVIDGEVVAFDGNLTSFQRLQRRMQVGDREEAQTTRVAVYLYVFDILHLDGRSTERLSQRTRKGVLKRVLELGGRLRYTAHRNQDGEAWLREACRKGWEGLVAKDARAPYAHGRSRSWLKFKCGHRQELVIGGYTDPRGDRVGFGALLLGFYDGGDLIYAGKVGTGFDDDTLRRLSHGLRSRERATSPYLGGDPPDDDAVHWVRPDLVAEVGFTEWTSAGRLRHPRFLGLRRDKDAEEVVREDGQ